MQNRYTRFLLKNIKNATSLLKPKLTQTNHYYSSLQQHKPLFHTTKLFSVPSYTQKPFKRDFFFHKINEVGDDDFIWMGLWAVDIVCWIWLYKTITDVKFNTEKNQHFEAMLEILDFSKEEKECIKKIFAAHDVDYATSNIQESSTEVARIYLIKTLQNLQSQACEDASTISPLRHMSSKQQNLFLEGMKLIYPETTKFALNEKHYQQCLRYVFEKVNMHNDNLHTQRMNLKPR